MQLEGQECWVSLVLSLFYLNFVLLSGVSYVQDSIAMSQGIYLHRVVFETCFNQPPHVARRRGFRRRCQLRLSLRPLCAVQCLGLATGGPRGSQRQPSGTVQLVEVFHSQEEYFKRK